MHFTPESENGSEEDKDKEKDESVHTSVLPSTGNCHQNPVAHGSPHTLLSIRQLYSGPML